MAELKRGDDPVAADNLPDWTRIPAGLLVIGVILILAIAILAVGATLYFS